jgi:hypothetical protein
MADKEWAGKALLDFQKSELVAIERVGQAKILLDMAKVEYESAKEELRGIRGCITEMSWQLKYFEEHGKLP